VSAQPKRVLFIEDNEGDIDLVRARLEKDNAEFEIHCADRLSTGLSALTATKPAVVLLDLYLPDSTGADTLRAVLTHAAGLPVVVLSGHDDEELALQALQQGAQDYLVKGTVDSVQLGRTLRRVIERYATSVVLSGNGRDCPALNDELRSDTLGDLLPLLTTIHQLVNSVLEDPARLTLHQCRRLGSALHNIKLFRSRIDELSRKKSAKARKMSSGASSAMSRENSDTLASLD
jgi:DNA-binding response OmpR family regulator